MFKINIYRNGDYYNVHYTSDYDINTGETFWECITAQPSSLRYFVEDLIKKHLPDSNEDK